MQQRAVGRTGLKVSRLGLGTGSWGRDTDEHEAHDQLVAYVEAGGNLLDTADSYGQGASETTIGSLLGAVVPRDDLVLVSKAGFAGRTGLDVSRGHLLDALDASLGRLGVDHLDIWMVAGWDAAVPVYETLSALDDAVRTGRTRYVGISNYAGWQAALCGSRVDALRQAPLIVNEVEYSLLNRAAERDVVPAAGHLGTGVFAWSPLGRGVLTGKYRGGIPADSRAASDHLADFVGRYLDDRSGRIVESVVRAAEGLSVSPAQIALAWVRDRLGVTSALVGARTAAQLKDTLAVEQIELPYEIAAALDDVSQGVR